MGIIPAGRNEARYGVVRNVEMLTCVKVEFVWITGKLSSTVVLMLLEYSGVLIRLESGVRLSATKA